MWCLISQLLNVLWQTSKWAELGCCKEQTVDMGKETPDSTSSTVLLHYINYDAQ